MAAAAMAVAAMAAAAMAAAAMAAAAMAAAAMAAAAMAAAAMAAAAMAAAAADSDDTTVNDGDTTGDDGDDTTDDGGDATMAGAPWGNDDAAGLVCQPADPCNPCTHTREPGYGFHAGVGAGKGRVTHGLPVMGTSCGSSWKSGLTAVRGHSKVVAVPSPRLAASDGIVSHFILVSFSLRHQRLLPPSFVRIRTSSHQFDNA
ncbi:hypothetical protein EDB85DRAFT_1894621 [Lactarius pseudohatsudake]|nr:hypothetical protein EDB85DRAFT_1894621 [Lactarius pseudohatsudake]